MLKSIMLRRKKSQIKGLFKNLLNENIVKIKMSKNQLSKYNKIKTQLDNKVDEYVKSNTLKRNWLHIFAIISKLRQICDHE